LEAIQPVGCFFVHLLHEGKYEYVTPVSLNNGKTNEKFTIKAVGHGDVSVISRYPMGANEEWIEKGGLGGTKLMHRIKID
jgi:hypothetical protein